MVVPDLIADLVTTRDAIITPLLAVLDAVGPIGRDVATPIRAIVSTVGAIVARSVRLSARSVRLPARSARFPARSARLSIAGRLPTAGR